MRADDLEPVAFAGPFHVVSDTADRLEIALVDELQHERGVCLLVLQKTRHQILDVGIHDHDAGGCGGP